MKIYIIGSRRESGRGKKWVEKAHEVGLECLHSAWVTVPPDGDHPLTDHERHDVAAFCFECVRGADLVWWLLPSTPSFGASVEWGIAMGLQKPRVVSGDLKLTAFSEHCTANFETDEMAFDWVVRRMLKCSR